MMYGQMTAGSWIYIGTQGIVQGTYETFVEAGRQHYGGNLKGKWILTGGLGGMGGAQPLAAVMAGACCLAVECDPDRIDFRLRTRYVDERAETLDEALAMIDRWTKAGEAKSVGLLGNAAEILPELVQARRPARHRHRPDLGARSAQRLSAEGLDAGRMAREARQAIRRPSRRRRAPRCASMSRRWSPSGMPACRRSTTATTSARWPRTKASKTPSPSRASCRPISARCSAAASARSAGRPCRAIRRTSTGPTPRCKELTPGNTHLHNWLDMAQRAHRLPGPAGAHLLGRPRRPPPPRPRLQRDGGERRTEGAGRHRPRPSRFRLRRLAEPRDRSDEGRLRRRLRLAAAQRAAQHRFRRHLGVAASRRRRRHGLLAACRHGHRRRRHADERRSGWSACCGTTRRPASCATPMPATTSPIDCAQGAPAQPAGHLGVQGCMRCMRFLPRRPTTAACRGRTAAA